MKLEEITAQRFEPDHKEGFIYFLCNNGEVVLMEAGSKVIVCPEAKYTPKGIFNRALSVSLCSQT